MRHLQTLAIQLMSVLASLPLLILQGREAQEEVVVATLSLRNTTPHRI